MIIILSLPCTFKTAPSFTLWQDCFIIWTANLKALKVHLRKGMLYLEVAKQQCDNLINRPSRNPYLCN